MQTLHIRKLRARYRLPASARDERRRLDAALQAALGEPLEDELARLGFDDGEEVCIRNVFAPVRLRLSATDAALARAWSRALAEAIGRAASGRQVAGVVRYASRLQALVDMAVGVALDDLSRAWAWRQLGLWSAGERASRQDALDELVYAFAAEPTTIVPIISTLAARGVFERLASRLTREHWRALVEAALYVAGAPGASELLSQSALTANQSAALLTDGSATALANQSATPTEEQSTTSRTNAPAATMREARRMVSTSRIARVSASILAQSSMRREDVECAVAVLVILESNQSALSQGEAEARSLINTVVLALRSRDDARPLAREEARANERERGGARTRAVEEFDAGREGEEKDARSSITPTASDASSANASEAYGSDANAAETVRARDTCEKENFFDDNFSDDERPLPVVRRRAFTRFGGLLFLLGLMDELGLPKEMSGDVALRERALRWSLHRVALALAPEAATDDAAALAFAGLPPDEAPPSEGEDAPSESETNVIASYASRVVEELRRRLDDWRDEPRASLLEFVCRRRAEVVADPGWFEVRLSLDDVTTEIRRAGLDLDPGYLPWLGAVVKFVYE